MEEEEVPMRRGYECRLGRDSAEKWADVTEDGVQRNQAVEGPAHSALESIPVSNRRSKSLKTGGPIWSGANRPPIDREGC